MRTIPRLFGREIQDRRLKRQKLELSLTLADSRRPLLLAALQRCVICLHGEKIRKVYEYGRIRDCKCRLERSRELGRVQTSDASLCRKIWGSLFGARRSFPGAGGKLESSAGRNRISNGSTGEAMVQLRGVPPGARG